MTLSGVWGRMLADGAPGPGVYRVLPAEVATRAGAVLYALDADARPHLLLPVAAGAQFRADAQSAGVQLVPHTLEEGGRAVQFADLVCLKPHVSELFARLAEDVIAEVRADPARPVGAAKEVLNRWRELLDRQRPALLDRAALAGLFGELFVLEQLCAANPRAVSLWRGPYRTPHDFGAGPAALEVKTVGVDQTRLTVHGVGQLEVPPCGTLHLALVSLAPAGGDGVRGETVPELLARVRAHGPDARVLDARLAAAGYADEDAAAYVQHRFAVEDLRLYRVDERFPRIVPASFADGALPRGVVHVSYAVDLAGLPAPLSAREAAALLHRLSEAA